MTAGVVTAIPSHMAVTKHSRLEPKGERCGKTGLSEDRQRQGDYWRRSDSLKVSAEDVRMR
jgi:hypothetical protein